MKLFVCGALGLLLVSLAECPVLPFFIAAFLAFFLSLPHHLPHHPAPPPSLPCASLTLPLLPRCPCLSLFASRPVWLSGSGLDTRSRPTVRARPAPAQQLDLKGEEGEWCLCLSGGSQQRACYT